MLTAQGLAAIEAQIHAIQVSAKALAAAVSAAAATTAVVTAVATLKGGEASSSNEPVREHFGALQTAVAAVTTLLTSLRLLDSPPTATTAVPVPAPAPHRPLAEAPTTSFVRRSHWDKLSPELKNTMLALASPVTQLLSGIDIQPLRPGGSGADRERTRSVCRDIFEHDLHNLLIDPKTAPTQAAAAAATAARALNFAAVLNDGVSLNYPDYLLIRSRSMFEVVHSKIDDRFVRQLYPVAVARDWLDLVRPGPRGECSIESSDVAQSGLPVHRVVALFAAQPTLSIDDGFIYNAARDGRVDLLRWADVFKPFDTQIGLKVAAEAAESGRVRVLEWVMERFGSECVAEALDEAATKGHLAVVEYLHERGAPATVAAMNGAVENGHIDVVKFLHSHRAEGCTADGIFGALYPSTEDREGLMAIAEVVKFLLEHRPEVADFEAATVYEPILKWFHVVPRACLEIIQVLHRRSFEGWTEAWAMDLAAGAGLLDVLEFLHSNRQEGCTKAAVNAAAAGGHLAVVKFLHNYYTANFTADAMDKAAAAGHLDVVEFLHNRRVEGCTKEAMNGAASNGHLNVVQYLHANRKEGCSKKAMDMAAERGYLEVVKFLHENRSEGCSSDAATRAFYKWHLDVVEYLEVNFGLTAEGRRRKKLGTNGESDDGSQRHASGKEITVPAFWTKVLEEQSRTGNPTVHLLPLEGMPVASMAVVVASCSDAAQCDQLALRCVQLGLAKHLDAVLEASPDALATASLKAVVGDNTLELWDAPSDDEPANRSERAAAIDGLGVAVLKSLHSRRPALFAARGAVTALMESCVRHLRFAMLQWLCEGFPEAASAHPMLAGFRPMLGMLARSGARTAVETMDFAVSRGSLDSVVWLRHCFGGVDAALELRAAEVVEHEAWRHISMESELEDSSSMQEDT